MNKETRHIIDKETRHRLTMAAVEQKGTIKVAELAAQFGVTEATVRRDLVELDSKNLVKRVHGGVTNSLGRSYEPTLTFRNTVNIGKKARIGKLAAELVNEGDCIALDIGSTTYEVASNLIGKRNLTIITPSFPIASRLINQPDIRLVLTGGIVRPGETSMVGEIAQRTFDILYVDLLFLGVGGIDAKEGLTEYNWDDTLVKKAMLKRAKKVVIVADSSKHNRIASFLIAPLEKINILITDQEPSSPLKEALKELNIKIIVA